MASIGNRLYRGDLNINFVGNAKRWYIASAVILLICLGSMGFRGFNFGIEFEGGNSFQFAGSEQQVDAVEAAVTDLGVEVVSVQVVGGNALLLRTPELGNDAAAEVASTVADVVGVDETDVSESAVSARWGGDITNKALQALIVFLVAVVIFIAIRFQPKMAVAAVAALLHDLVMTAGIYSLVGFEVTPSTVIGFLTILGFSLYDTVVVFDKVDENTRGILGGSRTTYSEAANLAVNQTLMRSINTSLIALLPVAGLLFVGAGLLGAGTLKDLALVLFVGLATGAYSSIFLATPILCDLKEREPAFVALRKRVEARKSSGRDAGDTGPGRPSAKRPTKPTGRPGAKPTGKQPVRAAAAKGAKQPAKAKQPVAAGTRAAGPVSTTKGSARVEAPSVAEANDPVEEAPTASPVADSPSVPSARRVRGVTASAPSVPTTAVDEPTADLDDADVDPGTDAPTTARTGSTAATSAGTTGGKTAPRTGGKPQPGSRPKNQRGRPAGKRKR